MKWSKLVSLVVAALGIGMLLCFGPGAFGARLRNIQNGVESWSRGTFIALDILGVSFITMSYFLYHRRNWARLILMAGCTCFSLLLLAAAVTLGVTVSNIVDGLFITGVFIWCLAGPLLLLSMLRHPQVVEDFSAVADVQPHVTNCAEQSQKKKRLIK
jgi:hypothetical protein